MRKWFKSLFCKHGEYEEALYVDSMGGVVIDVCKNCGKEKT